MPLDQFVKESIVNPDAYIAKGFSQGIMPTTFGSLSPQDIDALVAVITSGKQYRTGAPAIRPLVAWLA